MHRRFLASIALVLLPAQAGAERLEYGARSEAFWTDNVFGASEDEVGGAEVVDGSGARLAPWADVGDYEGRVTWGLRYAPTYEYYLDQRDLRGFDHDVGGRFAWQLGDRTTFSASERFQRYHTVSSFNEQAAPGESITTVGERQSFKVNTASGSILHQLGPLDQVSLSLSQSLYDYSEEGGNSNFLSADLSYDHTLSERTSVGTRFSWSRQTAERLEGSDEVTDYYNLSGFLSYAISPTSQFSLSAGPALIQDNSDDFEPPAQTVVALYPLRAGSNGSFFLDADTCPEDSPGVRVLGPQCKSVGLPVTVVSGNQVAVPFVGALPSVDTGNTTYFASATLSKQWERWSGALSYSRSAGQSTTIASVSDVVYGSLRWQIAQRWTADLGGSYEQRSQANDNFVLSPEVANAPSPVPAAYSGLVARSVALRAVQLDSGTGVDVMTANLRVAYQVASRASLYVVGDWREESFTGGASSLGGTNRVAVTIGLNYSFDPIQF